MNELPRASLSDTPSHLAIPSPGSTAIFVVLSRNLEFPLLSTTENHPKLLRARRTTEPAAMP